MLVWGLHPIDLAIVLAFLVGILAVELAVSRGVKQESDFLSLCERTGFLPKREIPHRLPHARRRLRRQPGVVVDHAGNRGSRNSGELSEHAASACSIGYDNAASLTK